MLTCFLFALQCTVLLNFFILMKENQNLPLDFQVEVLILSRRNILEQLMCVPRRGWQPLIRDDPLREGAGSHNPRWSTSGRRTSLVRFWILPLPILFKEDPAFWWQPIPCQFWSKKIKEDPAPWWQNLPLSEGLRPCEGGRLFMSSWSSGVGMTYHPESR